MQAGRPGGLPRRPPCIRTTGHDQAPRPRRRPQALPLRRCSSLSRELTRRPHQTAQGLPRDGRRGHPEGPYRQSRGSGGSPCQGSRPQVSCRHPRTRYQPLREVPADAAHDTEDAGRPTGVGGHQTGDDRRTMDDLPMADDHRKPGDHRTGGAGGRRKGEDGRSPPRSPPPRKPPRSPPSGRPPSNGGLRSRSNPRGLPPRWRSVMRVLLPVTQRVYVQERGSQLTQATPTRMAGIAPAPSSFGPSVNCVTTVLQTQGTGHAWPATSRCKCPSKVAAGPADA